MSNYRISASKGSDVGWHQKLLLGLRLAWVVPPNLKKSSIKLIVPVRWVCPLSYYRTPYLERAGLIYSVKISTRSVRLAFFLIYSILCRLICPYDYLVLPLSGPASKVNPSTHHRLKWSLPSLCLGHWLCSVWDCLFLLWAATSSSSLSACHCNLIVSYMPFPISISHGA